MDKTLAGSFSDKAIWMNFDEVGHDGKTVVTWKIVSTEGSEGMNPH